jgi:hydrogenase-4 component F
MVGALALAGSPPFNIFISKFTIISAGIFSGYTWLMVLCLLFLAVAFAAFLRMISTSVFGELPQDVTKGEIRISMLVPIAVLLILILALGLYLPPQYASLLNQATQVALSNQSVADFPGVLFTYGPTLTAGFSQAARLLAP